MRNRYQFGATYYRAVKYLEVLAIEHVHTTNKYVLVRAVPTTRDERPHTTVQYLNLLRAGLAFFSTTSTHGTVVGTRRTHREANEKASLALPCM